MNESALLNLIYQRSASLANAAVEVGPGDDCAVLRLGHSTSAAPGRLLVTVDHVIEHRHFFGPILPVAHPSATPHAPTPNPPTPGNPPTPPNPAGTPVDLVARKAIARSVSDIAAMAGTPAWALATAAFPPEFPQHLADQLFIAMHQHALSFGCPLIGGDIASTAPGAAVVLTVTVAGTPHPARGPVLRSTATPGDAVYVTGTIGRSFPSGRHLTFAPRVAEAHALAHLLGPDLHAMIDLSDGLGRDAARIAAASRLRIELFAADFPLADPAGPPNVQAADGEDYELLFTAAADARLPDSLLGTPLTRIGRAVAGSGCAIIDQTGHAWDATELGWNH